MNLKIRKKFGIRIYKEFYKRCRLSSDISENCSNLYKKRNILKSYKIIYVKILKNY